MIYRFITIRDRIQSVHDLDLRDDLTARRLAAENSACVSVETMQHRNVWRKPLTASEVHQLTTRGKLRTGSKTGAPR